jgi:hypothetical protein
MRNQILAKAGAAALAPSAAASSLGAARNALSSYAAGAKPGQPGLPVEVVFVFKSSTTAERVLRESQAAPHSGVAVTGSGDVLRVSGSDAAIQALS